MIAKHRDDLLIVGVALLARVIYLAEFSQTPTFLEPFLDASDYDRLARSATLGGDSPTPWFWQSVLYPMYLSAVYWLTNESVAVARVLQAILGTLTAWLTWRCGRQLGGRLVGLSAGLIVGLSGPTIVYDCSLLGTGLATLLATLSMAAILFVDHRTMHWKWLAALGLLAGLSALSRPNFVAALLLVGGAFLVRHRFRPEWKRVGIVSGCLLLVLLPISIWRYRVHGRFGFLPASGGVNLYIGNSADWKDKVALRPGAGWDALVRSTGIPPQSIYENQDHFVELASSYALEHPGATMVSTGEKLIQLTSTRELPRSMDVYVTHEWSWLTTLLAWKLWKFGFPGILILPLAAFAVVILWRRVPRPLILFLVGYWLPLLVVFPSSRFRAPMLPILAVLAGLGVTRLVEIKRSGRSLGRHVTGLLAVGLLLSIAGPFPQETGDYQKEYWELLGDRYFTTHRPDRALAMYEVGLKGYPNDPNLLSKSGEALAARGRHKEACERFREATAIRPEHAVTWNLFGVSLVALGRMPAAQDALEHAVSLDGEYFEALFNLGMAYQQQGSIDAAIKSYETADALRPNEPVVVQSLATALWQARRPGPAFDALESLLRSKPGEHGIRILYARMLIDARQYPKALEQLQAIPMSDPRYPEARSLIQQIEARR